VLLMFSAFGTATVTAVQKYLSDQKVPQLFFVTGASKWEDRKQYSWISDGNRPTVPKE
jgi:branched-chain amino acid transport system substrate-binding protein